MSRRTFVERVRAGDRVRLIRCTDPHTRLRTGDEGTVTLVDDWNTVHVHWDSGAQLGLVPGSGDLFERLDR